MFNLLTSLLLAGAALAAPSTLDPRAADTCTDKSRQTKHWTVKDFDFHASYIFTTPAHQNSWGYVNFTLENPNVAFKPQCSASSGQLSDFFYGNLIYKCTQPVSGVPATFTFSWPQKELKVNQTWTCPQEGSRFYAQGGSKLNLTCADNTWQNPDWKMGQIYSSRTISCNHVNAPVPIQAIQAVR
ncbi:hypothetical protein MAC_04278 [Metarhizium acridum CQMa 102]|uniref:AA1-like domain-containing protein n=1 Tax=Metarhizium acridum (strain CQMa 102) TaxID=655827 RepID=E9E330_METAQ|nr:uncharacterized protein MAC_04278 [Metarhizium acridum CQMa 102]EFY89625.1 hypothetical protein MAC_04278 [Metarhizium acridum CQMa 102]